MIIKIPDCGKGVNLDLTPEELQTGMWSACRNMRFRDGYAQRFNGMKRIFDAVTHEPHYITPYQLMTERYWVTAGSNKVYIDNGAVRTEATRQVELPTVTSIVRTSATVATVTYSAPHGLTTGNPIAVYNFFPTQYNQSSAPVTVTSPTVVLYTLSEDPVTNATTIGGTALVSAAASDYTGSRDDRWSGGTLGGVLVMNNGIDVPQYLQPGALRLRPLTGWTAASRCEFIVPFREYLVAFNILKDVAKPQDRKIHMMKWSTAAVPGTIPLSWNQNDPKLDAGEIDIADTPDLLVDALQWGDMLVVYKQRSMYSIRFVGQPAIFQKQRIPGESGMLFRGCGAVTPLGHVVLTAGDIVLFNGQSIKSIADGWVRNYAFDNIDSTNYKRAFVVANPQRSEVLICIPPLGESDCTQALVWNWQTSTWGLRDLDNMRYGAVGQIDNFTLTTWISDSESWESDSSSWVEDEYSPNESRLLLVNSTKVLNFDVSNTDDGSTPLPGELERTGLWLDDAQMVKLLKGLQMRIDAPAGAVVTVTFGAAMIPDSPPVWGTPMTFIVGQDFKVDGFAQGRYLAIKIACSSPWRLRAVDLDIVGAGGY